MSIARRFILPVLVLSLLLAACMEETTDDSGSTTQNDGVPDLTIVSGSENEEIEPIVQEFARRKGVTIEMSYLGSVDIRLLLETGAQIEYDAVWPANSLWLTLGDTQRVTRHSESIFRSPVVLGVKKSVAERLNWVGAEVRVRDILEAAESEDLRLMMTSATQSNSGASSYFGFLYALAGSPDVLTSEILNEAQLAEDIQAILGTLDRSAGSSGWLKDLFLSRYNEFDGMYNYESLIIEMNRELIATNREPLYVIYPVDGLAISDSPLAYVDKGDPDKEKLFLELQEYLLSEPVQEQVLDLGRRTGTLGLSIENANPAVFNPDWGIDTTRVIQPIRFPAAEVIDEALNLYQTAFRKPSYTVYLLDYSGSMEGEGRRQLLAAMNLLLDQSQASRYLLQASPRDVTLIIAFDHSIIQEWRLDGSDPEEYLNLYAQLERQQVVGRTNIYQPVERALELLQDVDTSRYFPAIILMTDGQSNEGLFEDVRQKYIDVEKDIPVFGITFGAASKDQIQQMTALTGGRIYDGTSDLVRAFRNAKGNN